MPKPISACSTSPASADAEEGIRQGLEDVKKGNKRPAREFFDEFEATLGIASLPALSATLPNCTGKSMPNIPAQPWNGTGVLKKPFSAWKNIPTDAL